MFNKRLLPLLAFAFSLAGCGDNSLLSGSFTDSRDDQVYRTVRIGGRTWMAENLNFATDSGSWCYGNNASNCNIYGRLYDWNTAMTACPAGWKLPTIGDWNALVKAAEANGWNAGERLKSRSPGWDGTDDLGFSALPGGGRGNDGSFWNVGDDGYWWSATEFGASNANYRYMYYDNEGVYSNWDFKDGGLSVRCVRD